MGNFYANVVVRGASAPAVRDALVEGGFRALVTPELRGCVIVYEDRSDEGDLGRLAELGRALSARLQATTLATLNHDDDALLIYLFDRGRRRTTYVTARGLLYGLPLTLNALLPVAAAWAICRSFGKLARLPYVWLILQIPHLFQVMRHAHLASALGLPVEPVLVGRRYVEKGELRQVFDRRDLLES